MSITRQSFSKPSLHSFDALNIAYVYGIPDRGTIFKYWPHIHRKSTEQHQGVTTFETAQYQCSSLMGFSNYVITMCRQWMRWNRLQLSADKTELMCCSLSVAGALVCPVNSVRDLRVFIDNDLGPATHVWRTVSTLFRCTPPASSVRRR